MKDLIIKILKEHSSYLDRSRTYEGIYEDNFEYVADALIKQFAMSGVMCSLLVEMQETIDYLKESRDYWMKQDELKKVISYDTCISQMEDVLSGYKNYT